MNIGIDATCWWNNRGFGRFTRELLTALFQLETNHHFYLFVDQSLHELADFSNVSVVQVASSRPTTEAAVADSSRSVFDMHKLYKAVADTPLDIMFFPAVYSWYPVPRGLPSMVTVHDAIAEHYPKLIFPKWKNRLFWTLKVKLALWRSSRILTVSQAAKAEIIEYMKVSGGSIDVAGAASNPNFKQTRDRALMLAARQRAQLPADAPIIVYVGGLAPHKNLHGLIDGFEKAIQSGRIGELHLALIGDFKGGGFLSNYDSLNEKVMASPTLCNRVHFSGYVSDEDLMALYSSAIAAAMPSFSEGFGLPAIEAMACSAPVLSSDRGSLPEVVGDAGLYFDPFDTQDICKAIIEIVENAALRARLSANAVARSRAFTWERAARLTLRHLENLHGS
ncbi:Mannosylfructose-phosphate synthase [Halioglobus japonicus]|nr:Mannosylfructose-phosphate synthase [Halioglobus japonicus]